MTPEQFVDAFAAERASAILRAPAQEMAARAMEAALRGGFRIIEFTMTVPGVLELIADFARREGVTVGAGTVLTVEEARRAVEAGARFLVSPVTDEAVIAAAGALGVACMPGTHTPTEMLRAHRAGAQLQKLFPAPGGGPAYVRSVLGPLPMLRIVPTNGVDADNVGQWLAAGAHAVGFTTSVFDPAEMKRGDFEQTEKRARAAYEAARAPTG